MGEIMGDHDDCTDLLEWLDDDYLNRILTGYEGKPVKVKTFYKKLATKKGENYASAMHLVMAEYTITTTPITSNNSSAENLRKISMIVKSRLKSDFMEEIEEEFNVFEREAQVYRIIMTSCEKILQDIEDNTIFGPRALYVDDRVIVQENLKEKGYAILDVKKGLDYEECKRVLEKLAKFHATTMVLNEQQPDLFKNHQNGNVSEIYTPLHDMYENSMETCLRYVKTIPELQKYLAKLEAFRKVLIQLMIKVFNRNLTGINVLNHGDVWVNNLMFKKEPSGRILDVLLVDYQEGYFGSPGIDLNYFIYSSWQKDVYQNSKDDLIEKYHSVLIKTLIELNYDQQIPTLDDIQREIRLKGHHGLTTATCLLPILISEHQELADPSNFLSDTEEDKEKRFTVFNNKRFGNLLEVYLKDFVSQGIL